MTLHIKHLNKLRFDKWAHNYDKDILQHLVFRASHNMFLKNILPYYKHKHDMKILDVGCGTGEFIFGLAKHLDGAQIHGVDLAYDMIKIAKSKSRDPRKLKFKVGDVEHLPYNDNSFNVITCSHSFHHYPDKKKAVQEMHRVLKQDGHLMIVDGCRDVLLGNVIFKVVEFVEKHVDHLLAHQIREIFHEAGFDKVEQKRFNFVPLLFTMGNARK